MWMDGISNFISNTQVKITQSKGKSQSMEPKIEYKGRVLKGKKPTLTHHTIQMSASSNRSNVHRRCECRIIKYHRLQRTRNQPVLGRTVIYHTHWSYQTHHESLTVLLTKDATAVITPRCCASVMPGHAPKECFLCSLYIAQNGSGKC